MSNYRLSSEARRDLFDIWDYIAADNVDAADRVGEELHEAMDRLSETPNIGHIREDLTDKPLRFWAVRSYMIVYSAEKHPIEIVRVLSGHRDLGAMLS